MGYDYARLTDDIKALTDSYNIVEQFSIGESVMGRSIPCIKIGRGDKKIFLSGAYHGLEYLTSALLMKFLDDYAESVTKCSDCCGFNAGELYEAVTLYVSPMINPDGVDIVVNGIDITNKLHRHLFSLVGVQDFAAVWQANANGVDINHNFDANWQAVSDSPAPTKYGGAYPESEPETRAVTALARRENFDMLFAFHSQGREIYYDFDGMTGARSLEIAQKLSEESGYKVCRPEGTGVFGGCKDWFIKEFGKEGFTIEIGTGKNPLPPDMLSGLYAENASMILRAMECVSDKKIELQ